MAKIAVGKRKKYRPVLWAAFIILFAYSLTLLMPLYYLLINSVKRMDDFLERGAWALPKMLWFRNYTDAAALTSGKVSFVGMYVNSIVLTASAVLISSATTTMTAYALGRFRFWGRDILVTIGVGALVLPDLGSATVVYKMFVDLNLIDTWFILVKYTTPVRLAVSYLVQSVQDGCRDLCGSGPDRRRGGMADFFADMPSDGQGSAGRNHGDPGHQQLERLLYALYVPAQPENFVDRLAGARHDRFSARSPEAVCGDGDCNHAAFDCLYRDA